MRVAKSESDEARQKAKLINVCFRCQRILNLQQGKACQTVKASSLLWREINVIVDTKIMFHLIDITTCNIFFRVDSMCDIQNYGCRFGDGMLYTRYLQTVLKNCIVKNNMSYYLYFYFISLTISNKLRDIFLLNIYLVFFFYI